MKEFLVSRGQLAVSLIEAGGKYRLIKNPWKPEFMAWMFVLDENTRQVAVDFYTEIGKPVPRILQAEVNEK